MRRVDCVLAWMLVSLCGGMLGGGITACSGEQTTDSGARFVVRYDKEMKQRIWLPEHASHLKPPKSAAMVIYETTQHPFEKPTPAHRKSAAQLVLACERAFQDNGWLDFDTAMSQGFEKLYGDELHYANPQNLFDDRILDCDHPEFLLYDPVEHHLLGFMFLARTLEEKGPQPGGPLTLWHYHLWAHPRCVERDLLVVGVVDEQGACASGEASYRSAEMMHVWFIDHPNGRFATRMGPGGRPRSRR